MAIIFVVRHAESIANTKGVYQGQTFDTSLSDLGKRQAVAVASFFVDKKLDRIIASPLKRTYETAEYISDKIGLKTRKELRIIETNHGIWEGKDRNWISINTPQLLEKWTLHPTEAIFPYGESFRQTIRRVEKYIYLTNWIGNSLIITHDNIARIIVCMAINMPFDNMWDTKIEPAAINAFEATGINGGRRLHPIFINNTDHLKKMRSKIAQHAL